jgi:Skp family chaperone for outer membrane proteins
MYVNLKNIIQNVPQYQELQQNYKNDYLNIIKELKQKQLSVDSTDSQQDFEKIQQEAANKLHVKYIKKFKELEMQIKDYVSQYAKDRGITIVLNSDSIIYGDNLCDITDNIVRYIINSSQNSSK